MKKTHARRCKDVPENPPTKFGQELSADTLVSKNKQSRGLDPDALSQRAEDIEKAMSYAIVFWDEGTEWLSFEPDAKRDLRAAKKALVNVVGPRAKVDKFYSDHSPELTRAASDLDWVHNPSTPFRSTNNGRVERKIQHVEEGTRTTIHRSAK